MAARTSYRKILVPIDGSAASRAGLDEALRLGAGGGRVRAVHVLDELVQARATTGAGVVDSPAVFESLRAGGQKVLAEADARARKAGVSAETEMLRSGAYQLADAILREAKRWGADIIVMGTHGRTGMRRLFLGSVAEAVLRGSKVPVLLVPAGGRGTRAAGGTKRARKKTSAKRAAK